MNDPIKFVKEQFHKNKLSWKNSFYQGLSTNEYQNYIPWYCYEAINFLEQKNLKDFLIFEFGCGASTLFYLRKGCKILCIETNKRWFEFIVDLIRKQQIKSDFLVIDQKNFFKNQNIEIHLMEDGLTNEKYQNFCQNISQERNILFDYIIVDSLKRYLCCKNSITALNKTGAIILDDSERKNYEKIFDFFAINNFENQDFFGIAPAQLRLKKTSFFSKKL